jgi:hypothetical protein
MKSLACAPSQGMPTTADEYLATHGVEAAISKAVAEVVMQRPSDPCEAIGHHLIAASKAVISMASSTEASSEPKDAEAASKRGEVASRPAAKPVDAEAAEKIAGYLKCMRAKLKRSGKGEQNAEMLLFRKDGDELHIEDFGGWAIRNASMTRMIKALDASGALPRDLPPLLLQTGDRCIARKTAGGGVELHLWQSQPVTAELRARLPLTRVLSMCGTPKYADIPVPDWCFDAWPEAGVPIGECTCLSARKPALDGL